MEVIYDLDFKAQELCRKIGLNMIRAATAGTHESFIRMIRELMLERMIGASQRYLGTGGPRPDVCPADCCLGKLS